ncbi:MAG: 30S ribosomal protein S16 [Acidimicrobiales bacterium]
MAVKLRLMRVGKKKQPAYRIVAADSRSPRDGRFIEIVGTYVPRSEPSAVKMDAAKAQKWLSQGAQPTKRVAKLLALPGVMLGDADGGTARAASGSASPPGSAPPAS